MTKSYFGALVVEWWHLQVAWWLNRWHYCLAVMGSWVWLQPRATSTCRVYFLTVFLWISSHTPETHWEFYWVSLKLALMSISYRKHRLWALLRREIDVTGVVQDWKIWLFSFKNSATPFHGLWLVLQHLSIELNSAELQYHTQPEDMCGAVFQNSGFVILDNLQLWQSLYTAADYVCII